MSQGISACRRSKSSRDARAATPNGWRVQPRCKRKREKIIHASSESDGARADKPIRLRTGLREGGQGARRIRQRLRGNTTSSTTSRTRSFRPWKRAICRRYGHSREGAQANLARWRRSKRQRPSTISRISRPSPKTRGKPPKGGSHVSKRNSSKAERRTKQTTALVEYAKKASDVAACHRSRDQG